jgi:GAF domain-containing protein
MNASLQSKDELLRLVALHDLDILDTPREEPFDTLVELACHLFDAPIAMLGFVDEDRIWFKAKKGIDRRSIARSDSLCAHTLLGNRPLVVEDTLSDPRFCDNVHVKFAPYIRFYAGAQIRTFDDHCVGTLCVLDTVIHHPSSLQVEHLELLARLGTQLIEYRRVGCMR